MLRNGGCRDRPAGWARSSRGCSRGGKRGQREGDPTRGSPTSSRYPPASRGWLPAAWRRGSAGSATSSREMPRAENNKLTSTLRHGERKDFFITLNILRGTLRRYSWRTADTEKTANTANCFGKPHLRRGL